jgi:hypothetical protein
MLMVLQSFTCMLTYTFVNKVIKTLSTHAQVLHPTRGRRQELNATRKSLTAVWMKSQVANQDVSCTVYISIQSELALGALEYLRSTEFVMDKSTISTCFRCIMFITNNYLAPREFSCFMQQSLPESIVAPSCHGSCCLAIDSSLPFSQHLTCFKARKQNHSVICTQPMNHLLVDIVNKVSDLELDSHGCLLESISFLVSDSFLAPSALQIIMCVT